MTIIYRGKTLLTERYMYFYNYFTVYLISPIYLVCSPCMHTLSDNRPREIDIKDVDKSVQKIYTERH